MRKPLTHISVSSILDFQNDRLRWCYKWLDNRVPRGVPQALVVGKIVHSAFENSFNTDTPVSDCLKALLVPFETSILTDREQKIYDELDGLIEPLTFWKDQFPLECTLEVEEPFETQLLSGLIFQGRPDRVAVVFGKAMHIQNKTVSAQTDLGNYITLAGRSLHELHYGSYLSKKYAKLGLEYGGTLYNIIKKLKYRSKTVTKAEPEGKILNTPESMFLQTVIGFDQKQVDLAKAELLYWSTEMKHTEACYLSGLAPGATRSRDAGYHGHGIDPYTRVMLGEISLEDDTHFQPREETYAAIEE